MWRRAARFTRRRELTCSTRTPASASCRAQRRRRFGAERAYPNKRMLSRLPSHRGDGTSSGPIREDLVRLHDLFWRTGKIEFEFSSPAGDMNLNGIQAAVLHPEAELFVDFSETVLLQAIAHAQASVRDGHIARLIAGCFGRRWDKCARCSTGVELPPKARA